jgi:tetratricopeptide (TPR) repeat protein
LIRINPQYEYAFRSRGNAHRYNRDHALAIADYDQAVLNNPRDELSVIWRGGVHSSQRDYVRAIADFDHAIGINPRSDLAFTSRGNVFAAQQDYAHAIADYDQAIGIDATNFDALAARCRARAAWGQQLDLARADCDASLLIIPGRDITLDSRGLVGLKQSRWQDAWNDYDAAVRAFATASHLYGRGIAALRLGRAAEGQADLAAATQLNADIAATYASYGLTP